MKTIALTEVKAKLSELVSRVVKTDEEVMITRNGKAAAYLVSADEYESWRETDTIRRDGDLMQEIRNGLKALRGKTELYTLDELFTS
ncbi:prevent-host-death protein [Candidatus Wirthbacteria bacterium CG2_30_54_11]|uniref:Antitoxin n=1 Tax=Candidatus Wirthbacteria bacterium CG2_30_54_11 TaxID=1817892 RepID=A0A1J5IKW1_9BACT|nr:MAG: prevent-host-death protein [Candidatus Wirthbacteria bacterium CG2_30_54_11]